MFCQNCGQENVDSAVFCVACGSKILVPQSASSERVEPYTAAVPKAGAPQRQPAEDRTQRPQKRTPADGMRTPDFSKVAMQARDTIQTNAPGPSISDNVDAGTIRLGGLELSYAEAIYAIGCIIAIIGSILPFFTFSAGAGGQATLQMSVNLIARGFWWLLVAWIAAGVTMHKGYPAAGIASGGFTVVFCIFFLVGWIMNGTTPGIGAFVIMLGGLVMLAGSIARTRPDLATSVRRTKAAAPQGRMSNVTTHETAPASEAQPEQIKICPACGSEEDADAKFCGNCGSKLS